MPNYANSLTSVRLRINVTPEVELGVNNNLEVQSHHVSIRAEDLIAVESGDDVASASGTDVVLTAPASEVDDFYTGKLIEIIVGLGIGEIRLITAYVGSTKTVTVESAWVDTPDATSDYKILNTADIFVYQLEGEDPQDPDNFLATLSNVCTPKDFNSLPKAIEPFTAATPTMFRHYEIRHYGTSWEELDQVVTDVKVDVSQLIDAFKVATANNTETTVTYTA